jgi:hypothetical protein
VVGRGRAIPFRWDGSLDDLPAGTGAVGLRAVSEQAAPTAVSALAAEVERDRQGHGLSRLILQAMALAARNAGLGPLVAPVRPSRKDQYPLISIDEYARWRRGDGLPFDPWLRVHARLRATILRCEPRSMEIAAPVADWERWTGLELPQPGEYVFPGGLAPLAVAAGMGRYWEPNVWMLHPEERPRGPAPAAAAEPVIDSQPGALRHLAARNMGYRSASPRSVPHCGGGTGSAL